MRMDQRQVLTPRMIQSMEILQLPLAALEERLDQELQQNPTLDLRDDDPDSMESDRARPVDEERSSADDVLSIPDSEKIAPAEFERLSRLAEYLDNDEFFANAGWRPGADERQGGGYGGVSEDGRDRKMDALANTAARSSSLAEVLLDEWRLVDLQPNIRKAGAKLIDYLNPNGYLTNSFDEIARESVPPIPVADLAEALKEVQKLDPPGIGARTLQECLLLQLDAIERDEDESENHDLPLERALIRDCLKDLELNRYPQISKKLNRSIDAIKLAVRRLARLHPHPGKLVATQDAPPITPDATITLDEETGEYNIAMASDPTSSIYIKGVYRKMMKDRSVDKSTREYLTNNVRNARWLIEAIAQRRSTIQRVIRVVVDAQREFFEKGPEFLRPLPMISVADQLGVHVATVSRAVSEKYIQTPRGIFPLRRFFSQGTVSAEGEDMSWDAVKEKLRIIISGENKENPLNDDEIVDALKAQGIDLARRTVAKYRKIMNIPTARQRRQF